MSKFLVVAVLLFSIFSSRLCQGEPAYRLSLYFDSPSFSGKITKSQVREVFGQIIENRMFVFNRAKITLKGSPQVCNVGFEFFNGTICDDVSFYSVRGRIPVGNLELLIKNRLKWPPSVVLKDLSIKLPVESLAKMVVDSHSIHKLEVIEQQCVYKGDLGILWNKEKSNNVLVKEFYKRGISLALKKQSIYLKNLNTLPLMILSGSVPEYLGQTKLHILGRPVVIPGGGLSFKASALVQNGKVHFESPLLKLAERSFGKSIGEISDRLNEAFGVVAFAEDVILSDRDVTFTGIGLLNMLDSVRARQVEKWYSSKPSIEPSLMLNRLH